MGVIWEGIVLGIDSSGQFIKALTQRPSRRDINRALGAILIATGVGIDPGASLEIEAKKKGRRRKQRKKNKKPRCGKARNIQLCNVPDFAECCDVTPNADGDPNEVCTECGCCPRNETNCCQGKGEGVCCGNNEKCCLGPNFEVHGCCTAEEKCCPTLGCVAKNTCCPAFRSANGVVAEADLCCDPEKETPCGGQRCCPNGSTCTTGTYNGTLRSSCCAPANVTKCCPGNSNPCNAASVPC
jgi:hypothetical protein